MSFLPPPPPPPPNAGPPPPSYPGSSTGSDDNRSALLKQIEKGKQLRKAQTNDRSAPIVDNNNASTRKPANQFQTTSTNNNNQSAANANQPAASLGALFANGIPKLKSTSSISRSNVLAAVETETPQNMNLQLKWNQPPPMRPHSASSAQTTTKGPPPPPPPPRQEIRPEQQSFSQISASISGFAAIPKRPQSEHLNKPAPPPPARAISQFNTTLEKEGRFTFRIDIPPPKRIMDQPISTPHQRLPSASSMKKAPPPPPSANTKRPPPPPPPATNLRRPSGSTFSKTTVSTYLSTTIPKLETQLSESLANQDFLKCAKLKEGLDSLKQLENEMEQLSEAMLKMKFENVKNVVDRL